MRTYVYISSAPSFLVLTREISAMSQDQWTQDHRNLPSEWPERETRSGWDAIPQLLHIINHVTALASHFIHVEETTAKITKGKDQKSEASRVSHPPAARVSVEQRVNTSAPWNSGNWHYRNLIFAYNIISPFRRLLPLRSLKRPANIHLPHRS